MTHTDLWWTKEKFGEHTPSRDGSSDEIGDKIKTIYEGGIKFTLFFKDMREFLTVEYLCKNLVHVCKSVNAKNSYCIIVCLNLTTTMPSSLKLKNLSLKLYFGGNKQKLFV